MPQKSSQQQLPGKPSAGVPLAERLRPVSLNEYIGQEHLTGPEGPLRKAIGSGRLPSMILWGPPGCGKTSLAFIISRQISRPFYSLSAVHSGVKDVRTVLEKAAQELAAGFGKAILFIDEIHRFSKSQQDSLLGAVEKGTITLIGATTENPSFEVISPLLSRCQVYVLKPLGKDDLLSMAKHAVAHDEVLKRKTVTFRETDALLHLSGGDARKMLNALELAADADTQEVVITNKLVTDAVQANLALYDKGGEMHYDVISAFIKSMRGSDPNAAVYWLARMIEGGEDPLFIARRMVILASEDIGNANPTALVLAQNCFQAVHTIGYPECRIILSQTVTYLASSPKSNAAYAAINSAQDLVRKTGDLPVPLHIRNAPTKLMKELGYGREYDYAHDHAGNFSAQEYLPDNIKGTTLYDPGKNAREEELRKRLRALWGEKYGY